MSKSVRRWQLRPITTHRLSMDSALSQRSVKQRHRSTQLCPGRQEAYSHVVSRSQYFHLITVTQISAVENGIQFSNSSLKAQRKPRITFMIIKGIFWTTQSTSCIQSMTYMTTHTSSLTLMTDTSPQTMAIHPPLKTTSQCPSLSKNKPWSLPCRTE